MTGQEGVGGVEDLVVCYGTGPVVGERDEKSLGGDVLDFAFEGERDVHGGEVAGGEVVDDEALERDLGGGTRVGELVELLLHTSQG